MELRWPQWKPMRKAQVGSDFEYRSDKKAKQEVEEELRRLDAEDVRVTYEPDFVANRSTAVAVYFRVKGTNVCLASDKYNRTACNLIAIAKHINAIRGMERWGVGTSAEALTGHRVLEAVK